ncbi:hypothetical protein [Helicobacter pylori]|uniref:hypothetical protein n=1 Tax=Helicobacter pylori TaxID=210 RepID=UPI001F09389D|nr:hypothetical protein [Helicobacter pylori]
MVIDFKGDPMSSDFKNPFIGANNSKRTQSNLIAKKPLSILTRYHLSLILAFKEYKEARSQLPFFKISVNPNQSLLVQLKEYDKKKSENGASDRVVSSSKLLLNYDF